MVYIAPLPTKPRRDRDVPRAPDATVPVKHAGPAQARRGVGRSEEGTGGGSGGGSAAVPDAAAAAARKQRDLATRRRAADQHATAVAASEMERQAELARLMLTRERAQAAAAGGLLPEASAVRRFDPGQVPGLGAPPGAPAPAAARSTAATAAASAAGASVAWPQTSAAAAGLNPPAAGQVACGFAAPFAPQRPMLLMQEARAQHQPRQQPSQPSEAGPWGIGLYEERQRAMRAAQQQQYKAELEAQIEARKAARRAAEANAQTREAAEAAARVARPPPWDPSARAARLGGGGEPHKDAAGNAVADLRGARGAQALGWSGAAGPAAHAPEACAPPAAEPPPYAPSASAAAVAAATAGAASVGGARPFMAAMTELRAGPSHQQRAAAAVAQQQLMADLDAQVQAQRAAKAAAAAAEAREAAREEAALQQHFARLRRGEDGCAPGALGAEGSLGPSQPSWWDGTAQQMPPLQPQQQRLQQQQYLHQHASVGRPAAAQQQQQTGWPAAAQQHEQPPLQSAPPGWQTLAQQQPYAPAAWLPEALPQHSQQQQQQQLTYASQQQQQQQQLTHASQQQPERVPRRRRPKMVIEAPWLDEAAARHTPAQAATSPPRAQASATALAAPPPLAPERSGFAAGRLPAATCAPAPAPPAGERSQGSSTLAALLQQLTMEQATLRTDLAAQASTLEQLAREGRAAAEQRDAAWEELRQARAALGLAPPGGQPPARAGLQPPWGEPLIGAAALDDCGDGGARCPDSRQFIVDTVLVPVPGEQLPIGEGQPRVEWEVQQQQPHQQQAGSQRQRQQQQQRSAWGRRVPPRAGSPGLLRAPSPAKTGSKTRAGPSPMRGRRAAQQLDDPSPRRAG